MITRLEPHEIFVFGSNLAGRHAGGAAKTAKELFGAEEGIGEGLTGQCYAFPTLKSDLTQRSHNELFESLQWFVLAASQNADKKFLLTKIGCGIAGYPEEYMRGLFQGLPPNVVLPDGWED